MATLRIVHTVNSVDPTQGGPSRTVPALCGHLAQERPDWRIQLVTSRAELARVVAASPPDLIHDHGQWLPLNHSAARAARRTGVPRIVSPRGMLSPWSRRHRQWKKKLAWALYAGRDMASAAVIHATSDLEMQELRELGVRQPIAVIPNGVDQRPLVAGGGASEARPYVLFMSRVHEKKGVRELLEAWQSLDRGPWELVLAGPDEQGLMKRLSMPPGARYVGMVDGEAKTRLLAEASLFVLPSYSENFGVVVAEAMMAAVPVIATHGTPWKILADEGCGWWIPMEQDRLASTLKSAMAETARARQSMGERGRAVAMAHFGWPRIASDMAAVYAWVLNGGSVPQCVDRR